MRILVAIGPVTLLDLKLFETTAPAAPEKPIIHHHYHFEDDGPDEDGPDEELNRKVRGEE